ncbi:MAG TPA: 16S rRNA (adenine(1518)-N(6)/adenine(1519)-N(6))-dimethyltransferase RsmA [Elusimicrobiota bacterium]|nr:16S rRNA (adenine(1518)-N(6)/adenine(1519)-N(6))-dimethyltransferase RsmA [Elusimicrobiota bacterium]
MPARLGQHFLSDERVRDRMAACAQIGKGRRVLEIGPGRGMLTRAFLAAGAELTAVEMDERLAAALEEEFSGRADFRLVRADFLKLNLAELGPASAGPFRIAANLPYSVASPILQKILPWEPWDEAVLMFQKEVALRIAAKPGTADYGVLTLSAWLYAQAEILFDVGPRSFSPPPQVQSSVVRLVRRPKPMLDAARQALFFRMAKAAFSQRRKMAQTPIAQAFAIPKNMAARVLSECGLSPSCRAQDIPPEAYALLAEKFAILKSKAAPEDIEKS